jgi:hypothetical protein
MVDLAGGESAEFKFEIPAGAKGRLELTATCGCGGQMIPHPRKPLAWICEKSRWWNRGKHAFLIGELR